MHDAIGRVPLLLYSAFWSPSTLFANITICFEVDFLDYEYGEFGAFVNGYDGVEPV